MKKILAFVMAMAMVLGMGVTSFAEESEGTNNPGQTTATLPSANDVATATVTNVEVGSTVIAYQIVQAKYNNGFIGYEVVSVEQDEKDVTLSIANAEAPTPQEVVAIASDATLLEKLKSVELSFKTKKVEGTDGEETVPDLNQDGTVNYTGSLNAGYWLVLVTGAADTVYNPMLVGVYYSVSGSDNTMVGGNLDSTEDWVLNGTTVYAKSTTPTIDKQIVDKDGKTTGDYDVAIGDTVYFQIDTAIPSYSSEYKEVIVEISDVLDTGLKLNQDSVEVYVGSGDNAVKVEAGSDTYTIMKEDNGFTISFASGYALGDGNGKAVKVKYNAELTNAANWNFNPNTNTATLKYTNNPSNKNEVGETDDETYTYTFAIDATMFGPGYDGESWNKVTDELMKGETVKKTVTTNGVTTTVEEFKALKGAEFTLTNKSTKQAYIATSGEDGKLTFKGLDAGAYTLVETKAPNGYSLNNKEIEVVISASYDDNGKLASYSITFDGERKAEYEATNEKIEGAPDTFTKVETTYQKLENGEWKEITLQDAKSLVEILNTQISSLPSTGGIGTTIFTIGGCAIMIIAAALFFATRRKAEK